MVMGDDGQGAYVKIPSILIGKKDGDIVKNYINKNPKAVITAILDFDIPNLNNHVN